FIIRFIEIKKSPSVLEGIFWCAQRPRTTHSIRVQGKDFRLPAQGGSLFWAAPNAPYGRIRRHSASRCHACLIAAYSNPS
ncbi:hypothetical protein KKF61_01995, partial [Patescibacteria group bacterium]|nr:hypothetical protein [Patescibacteria group bacterium]